jgi:hypothetical protein
MDPNQASYRLFGNDDKPTILPTNQWHHHPSSTDIIIIASPALVPYLVGSVTFVYVFDVSQSHASSCR